MCVVFESVLYIIDKLKGWLTQKLRIIIHLHLISDVHGFLSYTVQKSRYFEEY